LEFMIKYRIFAYMNPNHPNFKLNLNQKGSNNANYDKKIHNFIHSEHGLIKCTQYELCNTYNLSKQCVSALVTGKNKSCKSWKIFK
jgi:hypothetical protein